MGTQNTELIRCLSCHRMELDWRIHYEDDYTCSKCEDLQRFESHRNSFLTLYHHLEGILPLPLSLPHLFDYLYPSNLRHKHTRIQRKRTLRLFLLGASYTDNYIYNLHTQLQEQMMRGHRWRGRLYYQKSWNDQTEFITVLCAFLI